MRFSGLALAKRLESAEGHACVQFAEARHLLFPGSGAKWIEHAGAYAVFDGIDSPVTQSFGLGVFKALSDAALDVVEPFFLDRDAPALHEVSPLAGVAAMDLLCRRGYRPIEISNVLYRTVEKPGGAGREHVGARVARPEDAQLWTDIQARAWGHEHPESLAFSVRDRRSPFWARTASLLH